MTRPRRPSLVWLVVPTILAWIAAIFAHAWGFSLGWRQVQHPSGLPIVAALWVLACATAVVVLNGSIRIIRGRRRAAALATIGWALTPAALSAAYGGTVHWICSQRYIPGNLWLAAPSGMGASLAEAEIDARYPTRTEGRRVVMFHEHVPDAREQVAAMDRHLARLERVLGRKSIAKAHWVRGTILGRGDYQFQGLAMSNPSYPRSPGDVLSNLDRHELAHFAVNQFVHGGDRPPFVLVEGWAEAMSGQTSAQLATAAKDAGRPYSLRELFTEPWYSLDNGPVYYQGGILVDYIVRRFGGPTFLRLYLEIRRKSAADDVHRILGLSLDELDRDYWKEVERLTTNKNDSSLQNLASLPLDEGASADIWRAFVKNWGQRRRRHELPLADGALNEEWTNVSDGDNVSHRSKGRLEYARSGRQQRLLEVIGDHERLLLLTPEGPLWAVRDVGEPRWRDAISDPFLPASYHERTVERRLIAYGKPRDPTLEFGETLAYILDDGGAARVTRIEKLGEETMIDVDAVLSLPSGEHRSKWSAKFLAADWRLLSESVLREGPDGRSTEDKTYQFETAKDGIPRVVVERTIHRAVGSGDEPRTSRTVIERTIQYKPITSETSQSFLRNPYPLDRQAAGWRQAPAHWQVVWSLALALVVADLAQVGRLLVRLRRKKRGDSRESPRAVNPAASKQAPPEGPM